MEGGRLRAMRYAVAAVILVCSTLALPGRAEAVAVVASVSAGFSTSCAVTNAGDLYCWGKNDYGQLGDGSTTDRTSPVQVGAGQTWAQVSAGRFSSCAINTSGTAYCWGANVDGEIGDGSAVQRLSPTAVGGGLTWASLSTNDKLTCGVTTVGGGYCWGRNTWGQTGTGSAGADLMTPTAIAGGYTWSTISVGITSSCGVTTSGVGYCWGSGTWGALGNGSTGVDAASPSLVSGGLNWSTMSVGSIKACGVTTGGAGYCWGLSDNIWTLGDGGTNSSDTPKLVTGGHTWATVDPGDGVTCGRTTAGAAYCWGNNSPGSVGDGTTTDRVTPTLVGGSHTFAAVEVGGAASCALTTTATVFCWGWNSAGQLGDGTQTNRSLPIAVITLSSSVSQPNVSGIVDAALTFTVTGRVSACNSQSAAGFNAGATSTYIDLGHLNASLVSGGAQDLSVSSNAANGFIVYLRTSGTTPNAFRSAGGSTIADVSGSHASPSNSLAAGTAGFGYTTNDALIAFGSNKWAAITTSDASVVQANAGTMTKTGCVGYQATITGLTAAGTYQVPVIYTAVPAF